MKTVRFNTAKEFMTENKSVILNALKTEFWNKKTDAKELAVAFFAFVQNSDYARYWTLEMDAKTVSKTIANAVGTFAKETEYATNYNAVNDFKEERERAAWNSKSF